MLIGPLKTMQKKINFSSTGIYFNHPTQLQILPRTTLLQQPCTKCTKKKITKLTDGLLGNPTLWPHVVSKFTKHSRTRPCDIHGRFHPLNVAASAGDKLALRRGEFGVP